MSGGNDEAFYQEKYIANSVAVPQAQVRVIMPPTGGSFGGKQDPWPFIATALMVRAARRPVRLAYSRAESFDASPKRHPYTVRNKIGATAAGRLTGIRVHIDANTGGYDAGGQYIPNYAVTAGGGPYHWQAVDAYAQTVYTNGPKAGQYRGFGTAQSTFATECALDELAEKLGIDPIDIRRRNILKEGRPQAAGTIMRDAAIEPVLECLARKMEWDKPFDRGVGTIRRGRGIATTFWGKAWCDNLERYMDFANRLPRGRTYVRNGSVVDLAIARGTVEARVAGSELYTVTVHIAQMKRQRWRHVVTRCTGRIGSLVELLRGELSGEVLAVLAVLAAGTVAATAHSGLMGSGLDDGMGDAAVVVCIAVGGGLVAAGAVVFAMRKLRTPSWPVVSPPAPSLDVARAVPALLTRAGPPPLLQVFRL